MFGFNKGSTGYSSASNGITDATEVTAKRHQEYFGSFKETREYLFQVKNCRNRIILLKQRREYRADLDLDTAELDAAIDEAEKKLSSLLVEVTDEISKLNNVRQEMVMTKRYVDNLTWEEISDDMDLNTRAIQKLHGCGLPGMEKVLLADGKITEAEERHSYYDSHIATSDDYYND